MANILLIGNGAREHALADAIVRSSEKPALFAYMKANNPGIAVLCEGIELGDYSDVEKIVAFAQTLAADFVVVGPEDPLKQGVVDALEDVGIPCVGPKAELAQLETSKGFTRLLIEKHKIDGNPKFKVFKSIDGVSAFLKEIGQCVVKPDGLTGGKGVKVWGDHFESGAEAFAYAAECLLTHPAVVIEEKLDGEEFSLMSFTDGTTVLDCPPVQDHKRAQVGDKGPNTGGMGSYSDANHLLPFLSRDHIKAAHEITVKIAKALKSEFGAYHGVMYGGFIATKQGVKVIEYNARLGDPEAMNVLSILESDFCELCRAITTETLEDYDLKFKQLATVCKYAVPEGYPSHPVKAKKIEVPEIDSGVQMFLASVDHRADGLYLLGSRAVAVVGIGKSIEEAEKKAEFAIKKIKGPVFHREDIGTKALIQKRIDHMRLLHG